MTLRRSLAYGLTLLQALLIHEASAVAVERRGHVNPRSVGTTPPSLTPIRQITVTENAELAASLVTVTKTMTPTTKTPAVVTILSSLSSASVKKNAIVTLAASPATTLTAMMSTATAPSPTDYALKTNEDWYWHINDSALPNAHLSCSMQSDGLGRTVAVERLMSKISYVSCTSDGDLRIKWKDAASYTSAQDSWSWVNDSPGRYIMMIVKSPSCAGGERQPYRVSTCEGDDNTLVMTMGSAVAQDFVDGFPVMRLQIATSGINTGIAKRSDLQKRVSVNQAFNIAKDFSGTEILNQQITDNVNLALTCGTCNIAGSVDVTADVSFSLTDGVSGSIIIEPNGASATIGLSLVAQGQLQLTKSVQFVNVPLGNPFNIPAVGSLGPSLTVDLAADLTLSAAAELNLGSVTLSIPDNAKATLDFTDLGNSNTENFGPTFSAQGPSVNAEITATGTFGPNIVLGFDAQLFGKGAAAGLALAAPQLQANLAVNGGSCPAGVEIDAGVNAQLNAFAGIGNVADVAAESTISIVGTSTQIFSTCITVPSAADPTTTPGSGATGGVVGATLSDAGCQSILGTLATAPGVCASLGGDAAFTNDCTNDQNIVGVCCGAGQGCSTEIVNGVTGLCCA